MNGFVVINVDVENICSLDEWDCMWLEKNI